MLSWNRGWKRLCHWFCNLVYRFVQCFDATGWANNGKGIQSAENYSPSLPVHYFCGTFSEVVWPQKSGPHTHTHTHTHAILTANFPHKHDLPVAPLIILLHFFLDGASAWDRTSEIKKNWKKRQENTINYFDNYSVSKAFVSCDYD